MDVVELRKRLKRAPPAYAVYGDDGTEGRDAASTIAAVLIPLLSHPQGLTVLFTQRTPHLRSHSGQVSFPGGRSEERDLSPVETALREGYLKDPHVSVEVLTYRPFYILGEVQKPGEYPFTNGLTVMNAVATANGFTYRANKKRVFIKRAESADEVEYQAGIRPFFQSRVTGKQDGHYA